MPPKRRTRASTQANRSQNKQSVSNETQDLASQNIAIRPSPVNVVLLRLEHNNVIQLPVEACTNQEGMTVLQLGSTPLSSATTADGSSALQYILPSAISESSYILPHNTPETRQKETESPKPKRTMVSVLRNKSIMPPRPLTRRSSAAQRNSLKQAESDTNPWREIARNETSPFTSIEDLYKKFLQYQMCNNIGWTIMRDSASFSSVFIYNVKKPDDAGTYGLEIKEDLEPAVMVFGKYLEDDHPLLLSSKYPFQLFTVKEIIDFLRVLETYKICPGNDEAEMLELSDELVKDKNGYINPFTDAIHSDKCHVIFAEKTSSKRCKHCASYRIALSKRFKGASKSPSIMNDDIKKIQTQKQALKRKINQIKKKVEKLNDKLKNETRDVFGGTTDPKISRHNLLQLLQKQEVKLCKTKKSKLNVWHPVIIKWAVNYHSQFPSAYDVLQTLFELPASSTLYNYSSEFPSQIGFSETTLNKMKTKIDLDQLEEHQKYFGLIIDEMKLNAVDGESDDANRSTDEGRIFVMMLEGLTTNYKHVFAYFPSQHMNADERYGYLQEGIEILENNGFKILTVICDNSACNKKLIRLCTHSDPTRGVNNFKSKNTYAPKNEQRDIYYICDPTVLIKTARNGLTNSGANKYHFQYQKNGKFITWAHVRDMYKRDKKSNPRMCPKLTPMHIKVGSLYSQRVILAVQVMSNSVAIAIESIIGEEGYETAKFISKFNRFFDMLNSRNNSLGRIAINNDLHPYTSTDDSRFQWLEEEFLGYLYEWRSENEALDLPPKEKRRMIMTKETLEPIVVTVHSAIETVKFLLNKGAPYVCTNRFTRDALENQYGKYTKCDSYQ